MIKTINYTPYLRVPYGYVNFQKQRTKSKTKKLEQAHL